MQIENKPSKSISCCLLSLPLDLHSINYKLRGEAMDSLCTKSVTDLAVEIIEKEKDCPTPIDPIR
jgi:hypothetical protein